MNAIPNYVKIKGDFYEELTDPKKVGWFRAWLHNARYQNLRETVVMKKKKELKELDRLYRELKHASKHLLGYTVSLLFNYSKLFRS